MDPKNQLNSTIPATPGAGSFPSLNNHSRSFSLQQSPSRIPALPKAYEFTGVTVPGAPKYPKTHTSSTAKQSVTMTAESLGHRALNVGPGSFSDQRGSKSAQPIFASQPRLSSSHSSNYSRMQAPSSIRKSNLVALATSTRGRSYGCTTYTPEEEEVLLHLVNDIQPLGQDGWRRIQEEFNAVMEMSGGSKREATALKAKFNRLWKAKPPTGDAEMPEVNRKAIQIMDSLEEAGGSLHLDDTTTVAHTFPKQAFAHPSGHRNTALRTRIISDDVIEILNSDSESDMDVKPIIISDDEDVKPILSSEDIKPLIAPSLLSTHPPLSQPRHLPQAKTSSKGTTTVVKSFKTLPAAADQSPKPPKPMDMIQQLMSSFGPEAQVQRTMVQSLEAARNSLDTELRECRTRLESANLSAIEAKNRADVLQRENDRLREVLAQKEKSLDSNTFSSLLKLGSLIHHPGSHTPPPPCNGLHPVMQATLLAHPSTPSTSIVSHPHADMTAPSSFDAESSPSSGSIPPAITDTSSSSPGSSKIAGPGPQTLENRSNRLIELALAAEKLEGPDSSKST